MASAALCFLCAFASTASAESERDCRSANVPWYWHCDKPTSGEQHVGPGIDNTPPEPEEPPCEWEQGGDYRSASLLSTTQSPSVNSFSKGTGDGKQSGGNASNSGNGGRQ